MHVCRHVNLLNSHTWHSSRKKSSRLHVSQKVALFTAINFFWSTDNNTWSQKQKKPPPKTPHHPTISQLPLVSFQKLDQERDFCCWPISLSAFTHLHWLFRNQSKTYLKLSSEQKLKSWTQHSAAVNKHTNVNYINRQKQAEIVPLVPIYTLTPSFTRAGSHLLWAYITSGDALHG